MQNDITLELISVSRIRRSKNINPRKGRNKANFSKLIESIRNNGLLQPILVRPIHGEECAFEVVAGDSRFCAVIEIGGESIAAQIREMSDQDARVYAALENMDRADLTLIEEAQHAVILLCDMANDHEAVMKALSWSRTKLDSRVLLSHACEDVAEALLDEQIKIGHAELLCRLPEMDQPAILARIIEKGFSVIETRDRLLALTRDISTARFDSSECRSCIHNSGANADLFSVSLGDSRCQNASCWNQKTSQLIDVRLIEVQQEYGVAHTDLTLPQNGYVQLEAKGASGVGESQLAACLTCANYGAVVSTAAGREGEVAVGFCFDRNCNTDKQQQYKTLLAEASGQQPNQQHDATEPSGTTSRASTGESTNTQQIKNGSGVAKSAQPAQIKKAIRKEAFTLYGRVATKVVMDDRRLALAIAITSMYFDVRGELPATLRKRMESGLGVETSVQQSGRAQIEVQLAQRTEEDLLRVLSSMAASTIFRGDSAEQFDKSVSGSQSLAFIAHAGANPVEFFQMNEAYLKAQVKAGIVEDCKRSGFTVKFNEVNGEKAFDKLAGGKSDELIKAILAFTEFSWLGYLPAALELSAQGGTAKSNTSSQAA